LASTRLAGSAVLALCCEAIGPTGEVRDVHTHALLFGQAGCVARFRGSYAAALDYFFEKVGFLDFFKESWVLIIA
jgi:hypothetical protein